MNDTLQLRLFVKERLTLAVEEILGALDRTLSEYEDEVVRQRTLLDRVLKPKIQLHKIDSLQLSVCEEKIPYEERIGQESGLVQSGDVHPEDPHHHLLKDFQEGGSLQIKQEEEYQSSQRTDLLQGLEDYNIIHGQTNHGQGQSNHAQDQSVQTNHGHGQSGHAQIPSYFQNLVESEQREADPMTITSAERVKADVTAAPTANGHYRHSDCSVAEGSVHRGEWKEAGHQMSLLHTNKLQPVKSRHISGIRSMNRTSVHNMPRHAACGRSFETFSNSKPYKCNFCDKEFAIRWNRDVHLRVHTGEKPYTCSICGKEFCSSWNRNTHMRTHTGEKPYSCSVCGKEFSQIGNMRAHFRTHSEKTHRCAVCQQVFATWSDLINHRRSHSGEEKPHTCGICNRKFRFKSLLEGHVRSHTGEKPYSCSLCGKRFSQMGNMKVHVKTSHWRESSTQWAHM